MATNKNAQIRYKFLDEMLSDRHHFYDIHELTEKCNKKLHDADLPEVTRRCIEKDINALENSPFCAEIERFNYDGKRCVKYANPSFSIFHKELTNEERNLIAEMFNTIGQFEGLENFEWFDRLKAALKLEERPKIISFSNNPDLQNSNLLGTIFDCISNKVVVELTYHTFNDETQRKVVFYPYLLKQYNDRWYVLGAVEPDKFVCNFALDRIDEVKHLPEKTYCECSQDLSGRFEDIVGVTLEKDKKVEHIIFWVSEKSYNYVVTKPIHGSQKTYKNEKEAKLREQYPNLEGGKFFSIDCIPNYELIRELSSYGCDMVVIEPNSITQEILKRIHCMINAYSIAFDNKNNSYCNKK